MARISPSIALRPYIDHYVIEEKAAESVYRVYPGTSVVLGFQYKGRLSAVSGDTATGLSAAGVTGLSDRYKVFKSHPDTGTILVFFTSTGARAFFKLPVHELFGGSYSLMDFFPDSFIGETGEKLSAAGNHIQRIAVVEDFLTASLACTHEDPMVTRAVQILNTTKGNIRMSALASGLNISISRMEKRFRETVGASPKKYASIIRFNAFLEEAASSQSLMDVAYRLGYFDQAHFIKDFKAFTGQSPERYFALQALQ